MKIITLDVVTAYLYGSIIDQDIYLRIPGGLTIDKKTHALKLNKAIYGLKIAGKRWYDTLIAELLRMGFRRSNVDRCLFFKTASDGTLSILVIYVDDVLYGSNSEKDRLYVTETLKEKFRIKINLEPKSFVGLEISRDKETGQIYLSQSKYIERVANFNLTTGKPTTSPMERNLKIDRSNTPNDDTEFRSLIGALLFISQFSRPDI